MGIDEGFDLFPPLQGPEDEKCWNAFLRQVMDTYRSDPTVCCNEGEDLVFQVGEHPTLYLDPVRFRRFSSKVSGSCEAASPYLEAVCSIALKYFPDRIHWWSEYSEAAKPKYLWAEVIEAARQADTVSFENTGLDPGGQIPGQETELQHQILESATSKTLYFRDVCWWVLRAFETIHVGMNGLKFVSATFPPKAGYTIVQETVGTMLDSVNSAADWAGNDNDVTDLTTIKAYWASRVQNNCIALNESFFNVLEYCYKSIGYQTLSVIVHGDDGRTESIQLQSITLRKVALTPHHVGTLVEPPYVSKVPPSDDGETFHSFVVGLAVGSRIPFALDCSTAQFGVFGGDGNEPFLAMPLVAFLQRVSKQHRMLSVLEAMECSGDFSQLTKGKIEACTGMAIAAVNELSMSNAQED